MPTHIQTVFPKTGDEILAIERMPKHGKERRMKNDKHFQFASSLTPGL
jgi:hypothetical protein